MPFERMTASPRSERSGSQKGLLTVWGANHNFFNTEWQESDSSGCNGAGNTAIFDPHGMASTLQQSVGKSAMSAFFQRHLLPASRGALEWLNPLLDTDPALVAPIRLDRTYTAGDQATEATMLDNFNSELATAS